MTYHKRKVVPYLQVSIEKKNYNKTGKVLSSWLCSAYLNLWSNSKRGWYVSLKYGPQMNFKCQNVRERSAFQNQWSNKTLNLYRWLKLNTIFKKEKKKSPNSKVDQNKANSVWKVMVDSSLSSRLNTLNMSPRKNDEEK